MTLRLGWGTCSGWGFSIKYEPSEPALILEFIHWYFYIEVVK